MNNDIAHGVRYLTPIGVNTRDLSHLCNVLVAVVIAHIGASNISMPKSCSSGFVAKVPSPADGRA